MTAVVLRGDARALPLPDQSVDLVVTSPPYFGLRAYQDGGQAYDGQIGAESTPAEYVANLIDVVRECARVLKPTGSIFVNLGDKYAGRSGPQGATGQRADRAQASTYGRTAVHPVPDKSLIGLPWRFALAAVDDLGLILRRDIIWRKINGLPESVTDRCRSSHEYLFHLTKAPRYFAAIDEIREPHAEHTLRYYGPGTNARQRPANAAGNAQNGTKNRLTTVGVLGRLPDSVGDLASEPFTPPATSPLDGRPLPEHYAAFPSALVRRIVLGWSPAGGVVADPFGGTGTSALVASALGRTGVSVDASHDYARLARWRTCDRAQRAKVLGLAKPPVEVTGQADLLADLCAEAS
ncbi:DNA methyltransferase [Glutamicibacter sp. V16R2B1]|uniref:DNA-methyltransferase n=1 Tax=Glutamicibacter sp. V16R2B1 TaxID=2036207 RepID=UPI0010FE14CB|nr:DNA methyltransferase [Glutamicibacter sp. V16R2B1]TLK47401.1 methyltransferase domain-containing protein [Glutamicibacter sp. V16R2B1]